MLVLLTSLIAGSILPLAFAPFNLSPISIISPALLLYILLKSNPWQALIRGGCFGLGFFGVGVSWVFISIHHYGNANILLATLITGLFLLVLALFFATQSYCLVRFLNHKNLGIFCLLIFPTVWVLWEALRSFPLNGFPWLLLGYTQLSTPLKGFAPVIGVYGLSLITCMMSGCIVWVLKKPTIPTAIIALLILFTFSFSGWYLSQQQWTTSIPPALKVTLVQGNITQSMKWEPQQLNATLQTYQSLTEKHLDSQLIIWPEAAIPTFPQEVIQLLDNLNLLLQKHRIDLITGEPLVSSDDNYFNGLILLGSDQGQYKKRHLVAFGEYTPLSFIFSHLMKHLQIPMSDFTPGPKHQPLLKIHSIHLAPFICYEIAFSQEVLQAAHHSEMLLVISDDSWFNHSIALAQHRQIAQMRALETGRYVILTANTGITGFINEKGQLLSMAPLDQQATLTGQAIPMQGKTPLMFWNYYPLIFICAFIMCLALTTKTK